MGKKNKAYEIYGDLIYKHRPTIKTMIIDLLYEKFVNSKKQKASVYRPGAQFPPYQQEQPKQGFKYIAVISKKDNSVVEILKINEKAADTILDKKNFFVEFNPDQDRVKRGSIYKDKAFIEEDNEDNQI